MENYRALWHISRKLWATTNFRQRCAIDNLESDKHFKFNQNQTSVKWSKLGEKNCGISCEISEGEPALEPDITDFKER